MASSFHPLEDRVLIRADELPDRTAAGLHIPDAYRAQVAKRYPARGTVVATGPGMLMKNGDRWPMLVQEGERVIFLVDGAQKVQVGGEEHYVLRDDFVLAVLEDD